MSYARNHILRFGNCSEKLRRSFAVGRITKIPVLGLLKSCHVTSFYK
jgi:hypothetical protein